MALILAACATAPHPFRDAAAIEEQIAANFRDWPDDPDTFARLSPGALARDGRTLTVRTGARSFRFTDSGYCEGFMTCERYRADRIFHGRWLGITHVHGEYPNSYYIIDLNGGRRLFDTGVQPIPGPVAPLAALADAGEANQPILGGLAVLDLERQRPLLHRPDLYLDARIEGWESAACVRASHVADPARRDGERTTVWMAASGDRWALFTQRPDVCG
ncbi:MAG: hypothetical protein ACK4Z0_02505 [Sphingomonadaceae bacterium]